VALHLIGAPFQIKVWEALMSIPSGHVTTYTEIAHRIGNAKAVRAVGTAVGRNPISWLIPCHRALRRDGELGGTGVCCPSHFPSSAPICCLAAWRRSCCWARMWAPGF
jgi:O-6-methylguanine DNA methyltransferase